ncbi:MAG: cobalamin-dependent protein, partial [bacterium]
MKNLKITLIELAATLNGKLNGPIADDLYSHLTLPSRATDLLEALAKKKGYSDVVTINTKFNETPGQLTIAQRQRLISSDVVAISAITRTIDISYQLADEIKRTSPRTWVIVGGPHVSALPEEALNHTDIVAMREGDHTFTELLNVISENIINPDLNSVDGIAFRDKHGHTTMTKPRPFLTCEELSSLPFPVYSKDGLKKITHTVINLSRGCPFDCAYCAVVENFGRKFRYIDIDTSIDLINHTTNQLRKPIFFGDDNF